MACALQMGSEEWNEEQAMLGKESKFQGDRCQHYRSVYVTAVIRHENVAGDWINFFQTFYGDANTAQDEQRPAPEPRNLVRSASGAVKECGHKGYHGQRHRGQDDQRVGDQIRSYASQRHCRRRYSTHSIAPKPRP